MCRLLRAGRGVDDVPELRGPCVHTEVLVGPVVSGATHGVGGVEREVLEDRVRRVPRQRGPALGELLVDPDVPRWQGGVGHHRRRAEQHPAARVERVVPADVRPGDDRSDERVDLRFRQRMVAGSAHVGSPPCREVPVHVQAFGRCRRGHREPVVVLDQTLPLAPVALCAGRHAAVGRNCDEQSRLVRVGRPGAVRVGDAHLEDAAVTIDVLDGEARPLMRVGVRPGANAGTSPARAVGHRPLRSVRIDARHHIEGPGAQGAHHELVAGDEAVDEVLQHVARGDRGGEFDGMDAGVDPVRRLRVVARRTTNPSPWRGADRGLRTTSRTPRRSRDPGAPQRAAPARRATRRSAGSGRSRTGSGRLPRPGHYDLEPPAFPKLSAGASPDDA